LRSWKYFFSAQLNHKYIFYNQKKKSIGSGHYGGSGRSVGERREVEAVVVALVVAVVVVVWRKRDEGDGIFLLGYFLIENLSRKMIYF
jgi:hypothetical protein